jgi:hypothetical protein
MDAIGGRRPFGAARSADRRRLPVILALLTALGAPSVALGAAADPLLPPGPAQTGPTADLQVSPNPADPGETVTLDATNSSSPDGSIVSCEFDLTGDGQFTETRDTCILETSYTAGTYQPTVRVFTSNDRTATDSVELAVAPNEAPTPRIAVDPAAPEPGETIVLSGAESTDSDGQIESFLWDLPSGRVSGETVETSVAEPGDYLVSLTVVDDDGAENTTERVLAVEERNDPPTADLRVGTETPRVDEPVGLDASGSTDPDGTIAAYAWDFTGDGSTDRTTEGPETEFVPEATGTAAVAVTVIDEAGASDTATVRFEVAAATTTPPPTTAPATPAENATDEETLPGADRGLIPFVPDVLGLVLVLLVLLAAGAAISVRRSDLAAERVDWLRDLLTRGDVRRRVAQKLSGTTIKTAAKKAIKRFSDLIEAAGNAVGEVFERVGRAIKRGSERVAEWLRQFGA